MRLANAALPVDGDHGAFGAVALEGDGVEPERGFLNTFFEADPKAKITPLSPRDLKPTKPREPQVTGKANYRTVPPVFGCGLRMN